MPEIIEKCIWNAPEEIKEKLNKKGYMGLRTGIFVPEEDAYDYVIERVSMDENLCQEFRKMVVGWFYSGDWIEVE